MTEEELREDLYNIILKHLEGVTYNSEESIDEAVACVEAGIAEFNNKYSEEKH